MRKLVTAVVLLCGFGLLPPDLSAQERWKGIDESVIEKFAQERGREASPFFDIEGDLLLFLFTVAGGVGGFIMGYFWHKVFVAGKGGKRD